MHRFINKPKKINPSANMKILNNPLNQIMIKTVGIQYINYITDKKYNIIERKSIRQLQEIILDNYKKTSFDKNTLENFKLID